MRRILWAVLTLSVVVFATGCGRQASERPALTPPTGPALETEQSPTDDTSAARDQTERRLSEETISTVPARENAGSTKSAETNVPVPTDTDSMQPAEEVSQRKVIGAVGKSLFRSLIGAGQEEKDEEAPPFRGPRQQ